MPYKLIDVIVSVRVWDENILITHARKRWIKDRYGDISDISFTTEQRAEIAVEAAEDIKTVEQALFWLIDPTSLPGAEIVETNTDVINMGLVEAA